eukprot:7166844-Pyramimonas_sp.AAC.1
MPVNHGLPTNTGCCPPQWARPPLPPKLSRAALRFQQLQPLPQLLGVGAMPFQVHRQGASAMASRSSHSCQSSSRG